MEILLHVFAVEFVMHFRQRVEHLMMRVLLQFRARVGLKAAGVEHIEDQDRMVCHHGAAGFADQRRVGDLALIQDAHDALDDVRTVFRYGVVAAA